MKLTNIFLLISCVAFLNSCFDESGYEIEPQLIQKVKLPYSIYEEQVYFNLYDTNIVSHNNYTNWDLGFESTPSGYHIVLNTSKFMYAGNTGLNDFISTNSIPSDLMIFDKSNGNLDSTAIGNWGDFSDPLNPVFPGKVYIINRGTDENGNSLGYKKIVFEKLENDTYYIRFANLDNSDEHQFQIVKNPLKNYVLFSFNDEGNLSTSQPDKNSWDLNFTKYSTILLDNNGIPTPYLVRGVYINNGISVAKDTVSDFYSIDLNKAKSYSFSSKQDAIGFDWKIYKNENYIVKPHFVYIIKDLNENYYKLRFISFYNTIKNHPRYGEKGYTSFELSRITL